MDTFLSSLLTASISGSIVILAVLILRLVLRRTPKKFICMLWMVAGLRLLLPIPLQSKFSLQPPTVSFPYAESLRKYLLPVWLLVAGALVLVSLCSYLHLRRQVKNARKVRGGWECEGLDTAFVLGFLKPKIYIPAGVSENTRQQILAHERTHLDKGDHWIKLIGFLALVVHWFNPLVWVSYVLLCKDIEMACDERVVQFMDLPERKAYSAALLDCSTHRVHYAACPVAFGEVSVKYRIKSVLSYKKPAFWVSLLGILAIAFVAICLGTNPVDKQEDPEAALLQSSRETPEDFSPAVLPESAENPDWGLSVYTRDITPTGGSLVLEMNEQFHLAAENLKIFDSFLEHWNGDCWERQPCLTEDPQVATIEIGFGGSFDRPKEFYTLDMNWALNYGTLNAGDYRVVMTIRDDSRTDTFRAPFHIYRQTLPSVQESAVSRCESALNSLKESQSFSVLRSEKNEFDDQLSHVCRTTVDGIHYRLDYFAGEFAASTYRGDLSGTIREHLIQSELEPFALNQNRKILFPEGRSLISGQEVRFCSTWADEQGTVCQGMDQFLFDQSGNLTQVDRVTKNSSGEILSHIRLEVLPQQFWGFYIDDVPDLSIADAFAAGEDSPWNIFLRVDDDLLTPTSGEVWVAWNGIGVGNYTMDDSYWLEKQTLKGWQRLLGENISFPFGVTLEKLSGKTQIFTLDWSKAYGSLDAGVYRLGTRIYNGDQSIIQYAQFAIHAVGGYYGQGAEAAVARVDAAVQRLTDGSYHVRKVESISRQFPQEEVITQEFWQYGDSLVTAYFNDAGRYSHCYVETGDDRLGDGWYRRAYFPSPYNSIYFPQGRSLISENEITFLFSYSQNASDNPLERFTYRFDNSGNLASIERVGFDAMWGGYVTKYVIDPIPEEEICQKITAYQEEYNRRVQEMK